MISFLANASQVVLFLLGTFLIIVILLQRGRGGGLAGAFGGMGGQSAFGTKAGDVFTRITIVLAVCWVILAGGSGFLLRAASKGTRAVQLGSGQGAASATEEPGGGTTAGTTGETSSGPPQSSGEPSTSDQSPGTGSNPTPSTGGAGTAAPGGTLPGDPPAPTSSTPGEPTQSPQDK